MRVFLFFSYRGTRYHGWQYQPNAVSVQEEMEKALQTLLRVHIDIVAAGRTDTGVHARMMAAHADLPESLVPSSLPNLAFRLNGLLPLDIAVQRIVPVIPAAHARFDAISRTYEYHVTTAKDPFLQGFATRLWSVPDFEMMNKAAELLLEEKDFATFCKAHSDNKTTLCDVRRAFWRQTSPDTWVFTIEADRFLRNMVRAVVGTLLEVGRGRMTLDDFRAALQRRDRSAAGESVPAEGLYLTDIRYPDSLFLIS